MSPTLRIAVVGAGSMSRQHAQRSFTARREEVASAEQGTEGASVEKLCATVGFYSAFASQTDWPW